MATCVNCGKKIGFFASDPMYLKDAGELCDNCSKPIRQKLNMLNDPSNHNEFNKISAEIMTIAKEKYNENIIEAIDKLIDNIALRFEIPRIKDGSAYDIIEITEIEEVKPLFWYDFLKGFLIFWIIRFIITGLGYITGFNLLQYELELVQANVPISEIPNIIYEFFGVGLKILDVSCGILYLALAAFCVITRVKLSKFKKDGPLFFYILLALRAVVRVLYVLAFPFVVGIEYVDTTGVLTTAGFEVVIMIIALGLNFIYFKKRKNIFCK